MVVYLVVLTVACTGFDVFGGERKVLYEPIGESRDVMEGEAFNAIWTSLTISIVGLLSSEFEKDIIPLVRTKQGVNVMTPNLILDQDIMEALSLKDSGGF
ncbi:hypothetical protein PVK06_009431 [Gossypium arboreum]|uniref:Uncharacterized protein n=1 Tax=Gossypium arboreum TaxID=29729 RepID=A0ABR0QNF6_GOSAR|nr:hypothetical protein PVK06_009431 [Gossypium arboreum]